MTPSKPKKRGFAALKPKRRREISSMGGRKCQELGLAHKFTSEEGRAAALKKQAALKASNPP